MRSAVAAVLVAATALAVTGCTSNQSQEISEACVEAVRQGEIIAQVAEESMDGLEYALSVINNEPNSFSRLEASVYDLEELVDQGVTFPGYREVAAECVNGNDV